MKRLLAIFVAPVFCLSSCLEDDSETVSMEEYEYLQEEKEVVKRDLEKAYLELDEFDVKLEKFEELEVKAKTLELKEKEVEELQKSKEEAEEQIRELRKEFDAYQKKYEAKVRGEAAGEKMASLEVAGQTLQDVEIREVTASEIKLRHESGFATLDSETAPASLKERFFLRSEEEIAEREQELAAFLAPPVEEKVEEDTKPKRKTSKYAQRRIDREKEEEAMATLQSRIEKAIVVISGEGEEGAGFFAQDGITTYLYTAAHVLDRNTKLKIVDSKGKEWKSFGDLEIAEGLDLARLAVTAPVEQALTLRAIGETPDIGIEVAALGNANGDGEITKERGKLRGVQPTSYEISSSVLQGNSGGPVVNSAGEVLAVVTQLMQARDNVWEEKTTSSRTRRFACRVDAKITWKKTSLGSFITAQKKIDSYDRSTRLLFAFATLSPTMKGVNLDTGVGGGQTVMEIFEENRSMNVVRQVVAINEELSAKKMRVSERDLSKKFRSFFRSAHQSASKQSLAASSFSPYHQGEVEASLKFRKLANEAMGKAIKNLEEE